MECCGRQFTEQGLSQGYWAHRFQAHGERKTPEQRRASARAREERHRRRVGIQPRKPAGKRDRSREYARRKSRAQPKLEPLFPDLINGARVSYWDDELRMDLAQERELAILEGKDPEEAAQAYRSREHAWHRMTVPLAEWVA